MQVLNYSFSLTNHMIMLVRTGTNQLQQCGSMRVYLCSKGQSRRCPRKKRKYSCFSPRTPATAIAWQGFFLGANEIEFLLLRDGAVQRTAGQVASTAVTPDLIVAKGEDGC